MTGTKMAEYHVDDISGVHDLPELEGATYGANLSVRFNPTEADPPIFNWGHDEACAHEKAFNSLTWLGANGQQPLRPKDMGSALHASAFTNYNVGWNPKEAITDEQWEQINQRRRGKNYYADKSAEALYGTAEKKNLSRENCDAFLTVIRPGANRDGYWTLDQFVLQFEDLMDVVSVMLPHAKHLVSLDNSANHRGKRPGGLDITKMNKGYGGAQSMMEDTVVPHNLVRQYENDGYKTFLPGSTQPLTFQAGDDGPYWLSPETRDDLRHVKYTGNVKRRKFNKDELRQKLKDKVPSLDKLENRSMKQLSDLARRHEVDEFEMIDEIVKGSGWEGQAKGSAQLCMERGLIDAKRPYSVYLKAQLLALLSACSDFANEKCLMEWVAEKYGWQVVFSAKGYCDVAGFGIEYHWAVSKNYLHRIPLSDRTGYDKFRAVFDKAFSSEVLTLKTVRGCVRKCRQYMRAYLMVHYKRGDLNVDNATFITSLEEAFDEQLTHALIQKMYKQAKTHRSVLDLCGSAVREIEDETRDDRTN